jgi:hypothetical protein
MSKNSKLLLYNKQILKKRLNKREIFDTIQQHNEIFRVICEEKISYIKNIELPDIKKNNPYEAVLIEFRCFPHLEFLIRNTMIKLGDKWSHTVVCSNLNYDFMITMCANISSEITVIKTDYDNLNQSTYNLMLASKVFWELFAGEKILLYQEDSCIFKSNIDDFMQWDYIGAPWPNHQNDSLNGVGNGGFSLRTRQCMLDVIDKVSICDTKIETSTLEYMQNIGITICLENVYFSKNMQDYIIGKVADWDSSYAFCTESIYNEDSFGGNNFWISDKNWKERIYRLIDLICDKNDIEFKPIQNPKCVCIYAYYEKDEKYKENLRYFLNNGILDNIDYYIVINGSCTVTIPERSNLIVINRENKGYDFGAWNFCINNFINKKYDYYIFLNTSVRGPYLNDNDTDWVKEFLKLFNNKDVKLVGTTICIYSNAGGYFDRTLLRNISNHGGPYTHVQSMFFILDDESFNYLKKLDFFKQDFDNFKDLIENKEIGMSQLILKNNWNINCILPKYQNYDYRIIKQNFNPTGEDPCMRGSYFGKSIDPYEVIFFKNNRY